ncbi:hypothetical protein SEPCBS57363_000787 [Sporothrix epigloea]|uniref:CCHC-type domain-containing protein n=1 Tax=Sporothrix epigloea TaxID=1892477 RepID=A0ABP0D6P2_9PEZI
MRPMRPVRPVRPIHAIRSQLTTCLVCFYSSQRRSVKRIKREEKEREERKEERAERAQQHRELMQAMMTLMGSRSATPDPSSKSAVSDPVVASEPDVAVAPNDETTGTSKSAKSFNPTVFSAPAFSAKRNPDEFTDTIRELQLDFDWYAANGYLEGCRKPVDERSPGDFGILSTSITTQTPWYRCVFAIVCLQGLQVYRNHRERGLVANLQSSTIIADMSKLAKAYSLAPLHVVDGQGRLDAFVSCITAWDQRVGDMLRDRLLVLLPDRVVDGPRGYTLALRDLSSFARQKWTAFASALDAGPRLRTAAPFLVAASSLDTNDQDSDHEYFSDGGTLYHDQAFVTAFEKKRQQCFNCKKKGHWARDCSEPKSFKTIKTQRQDRSYSRPTQHRGMSRSRQDRPALGRAVNITGNLLYNDKPTRVFAAVDDPIRDPGDDSDAYSDAE